MTVKNYYYVSMHELKNIKKGEDFSGLFHKERSEKAKYKIHIENIQSCWGCSEEFFCSELVELPEGDFCDNCLQYRGDL